MHILSTKYRSHFAIFILSLFVAGPSFASHILGGGITYRYIGSAGSGMNKYEISVVIYEDCHNGQPEAIAQDNPAFISIFSSVGTLIDTTLYYTSSVVLPVILSNSCNNSLPQDYQLCVLKKTFTKTYNLPANTSGFTVAYQRCCRAGNIVNLKSPGDMGATYYCTIPGGNVINKSAVFKNDPPLVVCLNQGIYYDHSADDADRDSLSYELCAALTGASDANIKPVPSPPPYDSATYAPNFSSQYPMTSSHAISIDPVTGLITGVPNATGRYVVSICCNEWRGGTLIGKTMRDFVYTVVACNTELNNYHPNAGNDTTILAGHSIRLHASGGLYYSWTPSENLSNGNIGDPIAYFPNPGHYTYTMQAINDSGCNGSDTVNVWVIDHSEFVVANAFTPNGDNINDILKPVPVKGSTLLSFKVFNRWGNLVYSGGPADNGWDGRIKGVLQDSGVFQWMLEYTDSSGERHITHGNVTLIR